jgi:hypothetical protein
MTRFLAANWVWIALVAGFVAMHRRGHGCGGHGHHDHTSAPQPGHAHHSPERT